MTLEAVDRPPAKETPGPDRGEPLEGSDQRADEPAVIRMPVDVRSAALTVLAVLATVVVLQYAQAMIIPIVLGLLISYALEPIVATLARWHLPRPVASALVLVAITGASGQLLYGLRSEVNAIVEQLPDAARRLRRMIESDRPAPAAAIQE